MTRPLLATALLLVATAAWAEGPTLDPGLAWLAGDWVGTLDGAEVQELWTAPAGDAMLGLGRTTRDGRLAEFEYLMLRAGPGGVEYLASPGGRWPPTRFALSELEGTRAVFVNPDHDFPRRIEYRRDGDRLRVRIEGVEEGRPLALEWTLRRR